MASRRFIHSRFVNGTRVKILTARDHASPGRHVLTEPPSERHASKDRNPTTSPRKRDQIFTLEPKTVEAIDLETSIYALKYIKRLRSNQKSTRIFRTRVDWTKKSKSVDRELIPDQIGEEAGERTVLSEPPLFRRR
ncbi:hypothetical protein HID58_034634 [Brassica napus]|uniref:Uncharacterized protein n=1 Tax=Brassica napus TaxID=3708 RepID=A0ABQ8C2U5_BRANA|nr:hypothetical protein HID58_034634 [Brassica napus]